MVLLGSAGLRRDLVSLMDHRPVSCPVLDCGPSGGLWDILLAHEAAHRRPGPVDASVFCCRPLDGLREREPWCRGDWLRSRLRSGLARAASLEGPGRRGGDRDCRRGDRGHNGSALGGISPLDLRRRQDRSGLARSRCDLPSREFRAGIKDFSVSIAPVCSGFEGIGLIWAFLGGYLVLFRRDLRFPQALLLIPIGTVIIWLFNVLRIVVLVLVGAWGRPEVARGIPLPGGVAGVQHRGPGSSCLLAPGEVVLEG